MAGQPESEAGQQMFTQLARPRKRVPVILSLATHGLALYLILRVPAAIFIEPQLAALGNNGRSAQVVYLAQPPAPQISIPVKTITLVRKQAKLDLPKDVTSKHKQTTVAENQKPKRVTPNQLAGSSIGTVDDGFEHDIRPALPVIFPDPPIYRRDVPEDVVGDVIVEVTIDARGNVVATRVLASLGHGIEERVIQTLETWRFRPATRDGLPIASKQDVHFHLPS